jgi:hypothetical protein
VASFQNLCALDGLPVPDAEAVDAEIAARVGADREG